MLGYCRKLGNTPYPQMMQYQHVYKLSLHKHHVSAWINRLQWILLLASCRGFWVNLPPPMSKMVTRADDDQLRDRLAVPLVISSFSVGAHKTYCTTSTSLGILLKWAEMILNLELYGYLGCINCIQHSNPPRVSNVCNCYKSTLFCQSLSTLCNHYAIIMHYTRTTWWNMQEFSNPLIHFISYALVAE